MQSVFFQLVGVSVTISIVVVLLLLLSSYLNDRYAVKWRYFLWLFLAIRLIIPIDFGFTAPPLEMKFNDREIAAGVNQNYAVSMQIKDQNTNVQPISDAFLPAENQDAEGVDRLTVSRIVTWIYLAGIALFLLRQLGLYLAFRHSTRRWYRDVSNREVMDNFYDLKNNMGILKPFRIRVCRKILSPMITGLFQPTLLLPHEEYEREDLEVILKHELIHFRRNDLWFKLLLIFANALHWFNPFIYIMVREANKDIEISCDEEVLKGADLPLRKRYSERILELMQGNNHQEAPVSTNFHGGKGMMKNRIRNIFDERTKKKGVLSFLAILSILIVFSACKFDIGQNYWKIYPAFTTLESAWGANSELNANLAYDQDHNGAVDTTFTLLVEGDAAYLKYKGVNGKTAQEQVLKDVEPGFDYSLRAANLEDTNSIAFIVSVDYRGMPFGSGYWELYSWDGDDFKQIDLKPVEENLQMRILEPSQVRDNSMNARTIVYLYDADKYPANYPTAGLFFKDEMKEDGKGPKTIAYAPLSEYDVEGYKTWGQGAINKIMTGMDFIPGTDVKDWNHPELALLRTQETVFMTLPNVTATVTRYYTYQDGEWISVDGSISQASEDTL